MHRRKNAHDYSLFLRWNCILQYDLQILYSHSVLSDEAHSQHNIIITDVIHNIVYDCTLISLRDEVLANIVPICTHSTQLGHDVFLYDIFIYNMNACTICMCILYFIYFSLWIRIIIVRV